MLTALLRPALLLVILAASVPLGAAQANPEARLLGLFDRIDANHDGAISLAEWEDWRARMRDRRGQHGAGATAEDAHLTMNQVAHVGGAAGNGAGAPTERAAAGPTTRGEHRLFDRIDANRDGRIERDEWIAWVRERLAHRRHQAQPPVQPGPALPAQVGAAGSAPASAAH